MGELEVNITYQTLYEIVRNEKNRDELQKLPEHFFDNLFDYLKLKHAQFDKTKYKSDLFSATERDKLSIQIRNIHHLIKELYSRRESKILSIALHKSRTQQVVSTESLETREYAMFESLVQTLSNGQSAALGFLQSQGVPVREPAPLRMGPEITADSENESVQPESSEDESESFEPNYEDPGIESNMGEVDPSEPLPEDDSSADSSNDADKIKVRFIKPVQQFIGKELETYGPFEAAQESSLPEEIARILISRGRAVEIE